MFKKIFCVLFIVLFTVSVVTVPASAYTPTNFEIDAEGAMLVNMDTGDILETVKVKIGDNETAEELFERLSVISADLMLSTINKLEKGEIIPKKQERDATYAPIIKKEMALLDFNKPAKELFNAVRGYYSWPCAYFFMDGKRMKVIKAAVGSKTEKAGGSVIGNNGVLSIACGDGFALDILVLQAEGSKVMEAKQYLCGMQIPLGTVVGE